jgi:hypothetical protein
LIIVLHGEVDHGHQTFTHSALSGELVIFPTMLVKDDDERYISPTDPPKKISHHKRDAGRYKCWTSSFLQGRRSTSRSRIRNDLVSFRCDPTLAYSLQGPANQLLVQADVQCFFSYQETMRTALIVVSIIVDSEFLDCC